MVTIAHLVGKIVKRQPFIEEALSRGLINYGSLADSFLPEIKRELGKDVKHSAVMMALRRYSDTAKVKLFKKIKFDDNSSLKLRSDLIEITIIKEYDSTELLKKLQSFVNPKNGDSISIIMGDHEISILISKKHEKDFLNCINKRLIKKITKDLSSLTINIPENSVDTVGLFYLLTRTLSWENIAIVELISTWSEVSFIIRTKDAPFAFKVIKDLIDENS